MFLCSSKEISSLSSKEENNPLPAGCIWILLNCTEEVSALIASVSINVLICPVSRIVGMMVSCDC